MKIVWVKIAPAGIVARQVPYRVARQGVCDVTSAKDATRHSMPRPAPPRPARLCRVCSARISGLPWEAVLLIGRRFVLQQNVAGLPSIPPCVGGPGFLPQKASKHASSRALWLTGIVEADDTYVPESRKGARSLERKARRRAGRSGGRASKRGLSDEQVPARVAADCSGATVSAVLPAVNADTLADTLPEVIAPVVDENIVLLTDGHRACPGCAAATWGASRSIEPVTKGTGARHLSHSDGQQPTQPVEGLLAVLSRRRATRYPDNHLRWFERLELENASPRACLATAIRRPCIQLVN